MISQQIFDTIAALKSGWQSAPLLVSEGQAAEICSVLFEEEILSLDDLENRWITDFIYYDCADRSHKWAEHYKVKVLKEHVEKLYQKPSGNILVAIFRNIEALGASWEQKSENALLHLFEDVPAQLIIIVTSKSPGKIISTLQSRMIMMDPGSAQWGINPHQEAIDAYVSGDVEPLFAMTLAPSKESKFTRDDALWVIRGLQEAIEYGTLSPRHAWRISETRVLLETTNTIAKYLIDQLLISLACE
jgi:hypothetical protein